MDYLNHLVGDHNGRDLCVHAVLRHAVVRLDVLRVDSLLLDIVAADGLLSRLESRL